MAQLEIHYDVALGEEVSRAGVVRNGEARVCADSRKEELLVARRELRVDHRRQRLVVDPDQVRRVDGTCVVLGHDRHHGFADEADHVRGQPGPHHALLQRGQPRRQGRKAQVGRREHRDDTVRSTGAFHIHPA